MRPRGFPLLPLAGVLLASFVAIIARVEAQGSPLEVASGAAPLRLPPEFAIRVAELHAALEKAEEANDVQAQLAALDQMGSIYHSRGGLAEALAYYKQVLPLARSIHRETEEAKALCNIGASDFALGHADEALDDFKQALPIWQ